MQTNRLLANEVRRLTDCGLAPPHPYLACRFSIFGVFIGGDEKKVLYRRLLLDSNVRKPADAEKYRLETIAEAQKQKIIMEAEAEAEALALKGNSAGSDVTVIFFWKWCKSKCTPEVMSLLLSAGSDITLIICQK
jgi:hypothetical protein